MVGAPARTTLSTHSEEEAQTHNGSTHTPRSKAHTQGVGAHTRPKGVEARTHTKQKGTHPRPPKEEEAAHARRGEGAHDWSRQKLKGEHALTEKKMKHNPPSTGHAGKFDVESQVPFPLNSRKSGRDTTFRWYLTIFKVNKTEKKPFPAPSLKMTLTHHHSRSENLIPSNN